MHALQKLALYSILGKPSVFYFGITTLICLLFTASIAILTHRGIRKIPFKYHPIMAKITIFFALVHAILALSFYL